MKSNDLYLSCTLVITFTREPVKTRCGKEIEMELKIGAVIMRNMSITEICYESGEGLTIAVNKYDDYNIKTGFLTFDKQETNTLIAALEKD